MNNTECLSHVYTSWSGAWIMNACGVDSLAMKIPMADQRWLLSDFPGHCFPGIGGKTAQFHIAFWFWVQVFLLTTENGCQDESFKWLCFTWPSIPFLPLEKFTFPSNILSCMSSVPCTIAHTPGLVILRKVQTPKVHQFLGLHAFHEEPFHLLGYTVPLNLDNPQQLVGQKNYSRGSLGSK